MRRAGIALVLLLLGCDGCGASPSSQAPAVTVELDVGDNGALAYRATVTTTGASPEPQTSEVNFFLERDATGATIVRTGDVDNATTVSWRGGARSEDMPRFEFPVPVDGMEASWRMETLGMSGGRQIPAVDMVDRFRVEEDGSPVVVLAFERALTLSDEMGDGSMTATLRYDRDAKRYASLTGERVLRMVTRSQPGMDALSLETRNEFVYEFDAAMSAARTAFLAELAAARERARGQLAQYQSDHSVDAEIAEALSAPRPGFLVKFHLVANPRQVWSQALQGDSREAFLAGFAAAAFAPGVLPDEALEVLKERAGEWPEVDAFASRIRDPRAVEVLQRLADRDGPSQTQAQTTLAALATRPAEDLLTVPSGRLGEVGTPIVMRVRTLADTKPIASVLIQILGREALPEIDKQFCLQWLEMITSRNLGDDAAAWRAFWEAHQSESVTTWAVTAAREELPILRLNALSQLSRGEGPAAARAVMVENLAHSHEDVRLAAAQALVALGDDRGIATLIGFLRGGNQKRARAIMALAEIADRSLGYVPHGEEREREIAAARWEAWAASR